MATARRRPTISDVARAASVSITTVSDAMSGKGRVDPATRQRVLDAAAAAGWKPRRSARALRSGRTGIVALCIPAERSSWANWMRHSDYFQHLSAACAAAAVDRGRMLLLAPRPADAAELDALDVDGLLVADPGRDDPVVQLCLEASVPVVTIDRQPGDTGPWWAGNDHAAGAGRALDHLHERGSRRIALLTSSAPWAWFDDTLRAYREWCAAAGADPIVADVDLDETIASSGAVFGALLDRDDTIDGVLVLPTHGAIGAVQAVQQRGRRVPDDVRVVAGVDSMAVATSGITALDLRPAALGEAAVGLLERRIRSSPTGPAASPELVESALQVRSSS